MRATLTLGRIRGITVGVHWSVVVVLAIVAVGLAQQRLPDDLGGYSTTAYWAAAIVTAVLFLASILAHEVSHSLVARRRGVEVDSITLWLLGGISQLRGDATSPGDAFWIAVVGPLTSLAIGVVAGAAAFAVRAVDVSPLIVWMLAWLSAINVVLGLFNLVPAAPLDGGRVLAAALWKWKKDRLRATIIASTVGRAFGYLLVALGAFLFFNNSAEGLWDVLLGWFLINAAAAEEERARTEQSLGSLQVRDLMTADPATAPADIDVERFVDDYVMRSHHSTFPVLDGDGQVRGLFTLRQAKALPRERWSATRIGDLACPFSEVPTARPDEPAAVAVERMDDRCAEGRVLVLDDARLVGILSPSDVRRAFELARFRRPDDPQGTFSDAHAGSRPR
ncbi:MAG: hypothetical protein QOI55_2736 [Actinomycetota bacterium]|nr:hypothetical protein [Actinomycetota bacterium]